VAGGYDGSDVNSPSKDQRNLSERFVYEIDGTTSFGLRGKIWTCKGCLDSGTDFVKDLSNVQSTDPQRDLGIAASFEISVGSVSVELGDVDNSERWAITVRKRGTTDTDAEFIINGRYALTDSSNSSCNFDVTYDTSTSDPLYSPNFPNGATPTKGTVDVTVNSGDNAGTTYTINYDTGDSDTIEIDGDELSRTDSTCSTTVSTSS
jgi:hypothetical protein